MAVFEYLLVSVIAVQYVVAAAVLTQSKSIPVIGQPLVLTYTNYQTSNITDMVIFLLDTTNIEGTCLAYDNVDKGECGSGEGNLVTRQSGNVITLEIPSFDATRHAGIWKVTEGLTVTSNSLTFTAPFATMVKISVINYTNACPSLKHIDLEDFTVRIITGCAYPTVNMYWSFGDHTLTPVITSDSTRCTAPQVKTSVVLTHRSLQGSVNVTVHMTHPSFNNELYDKYICVADFPGSAVLKIKPCIPKWYEGVAIQLTCVHISGTIQTSVSVYRGENAITECNSTFGNCFSWNSAKYNIVTTTPSSVIIRILHFDRTKDVANWTCRDASGSSTTICTIVESAIVSVRDNGLTSLQTQIVTLPFSVSVTGRCTYPLPTCTWKYTATGESERNISDELTTIISNSASCNSGDVEATCILQFTTVPTEFVGKSLTLAVSISHPSLPGAPIELSSSAVITLPKPPASPTLSGDCPGSYITPGQTGTFTCSTTDPGIPAASVTWINPDGTDTGSGSLQLNSILRRYNNRPFTCRARNAVGSKQVTFTPKLALMQPFPESCYCTDSSDNSVNLQWRYDGNNSSVLNSFTILKRSGNGNRWTDLSFSSPFGDRGLFTLKVGQLQQTSRYYFKIYLSDGDGASIYCLTSCKTDSVTGTTSSGLTGAGVAVGMVVGIAVMSLTFIIVIILWRRGFLFKSKSVEHQAETNAYQDISLSDRMTETGNELPTTSEQAHTYEGLENREATPYSKLELYENLKS